jgi:hypothetical protein
MAGNSSLDVRTAMDPLQWMRMWQAWWGTAPEHLVQPILPGWTFNINSTNSTAPQTEVAVLARHSYGRQLGRMSDAVELLIQESHGKNLKNRAFTDFLAMKRDIDETKRVAAATRIEQIIKDLALLKDQDEQQYKRLREALRQALK